MYNSNTLWYDEVYVHEYIWSCYISPLEIWWHTTVHIIVSNYPEHKIYGQPFSGRRPLLNNLSLSIPLIVMLIVMLYTADRDQLGTIVITSEGIRSLDGLHVVEYKEAEYINSFRSRTHIYVGNLKIIVSDNGLSPGGCQVIAGMLSIGSLGTNLSESLIHKPSFEKKHLNISSVKCRPFCLGLNVLRYL